MTLFKEEPTNNSLGSYRLTTWLHPHSCNNYKHSNIVCQETVR